MQALDLGLDIYDSTVPTTVVTNPLDMTEYSVGIHSDHSFPDGISWVTIAYGLAS
jgi:hypothetical protein